MNILILGGTVFLGRALVEAALPRGHRLTLFNRGKSNPDLFPQVKQLHGDRRTDLSSLVGRRWDAVIDTCGYRPNDVRRSAELLAGNAANYAFISSLSVYAETSKPGIAEDGELACLPEGANLEDVTGETYGPLKVLCEQAAESALPGRALIVRPGLIVGPHDPTDRFTYWPWRVSRGGKVLCPGDPTSPTQFIDVRDLAEWILMVVEAGQSGVYNAGGPTRSMGELLEACQRVSGSGAHLCWVSEAILAAQGVSGWSDLPAWMPSEAEYAGFFRFSSARAEAAGLAYRPLEDTVRATLDWALTRPADHAWRAGLKPEREVELLAL